MPMWFDTPHGKPLAPQPPLPADNLDPLGREDRIACAEARFRAVDVALRVAGHEVDEATIARVLDAEKAARLRFYPA